MQEKYGGLECDSSLMRQVEYGRKRCNKPHINLQDIDTSRTEIKRHDTLNIVRESKT